jgi:hypothetical protein
MTFSSGSRGTWCPLWVEHVPNVYAVGDVTSVGTPKAGIFAEGPGLGRRRADRLAGARRFCTGNL